MATSPLLEFSVSSKDKPVLLCDGFISNLNKKHGNVKNLADRFEKKKITFVKYMEGLSLVIARRR
jgi:hypothetical protein